MAIEILSMICPLLFKKDVSVYSDDVEESVVVGGNEIDCENLPFKNVSSGADVEDDDDVVVVVTCTTPDS